MMMVMLMMITKSIVFVLMLSSEDNIDNGDGNGCADDVDNNDYNNRKR